MYNESHKLIDKLYTNHFYINLCMTPSFVSYRSHYQKAHTFSNEQTLKLCGWNIFYKLCQNQLPGSFCTLLISAGVGMVRREHAHFEHVTYPSQSRVLPPAGILWKLTMQKTYVNYSSAFWIAQDSVSVIQQSAPSRCSADMVSARSRLVGRGMTRGHGMFEMHSR